MKFKPDKWNKRGNYSNKETKEIVSVEEIKIPGIRDVSYHIWRIAGYSQGSLGYLKPDEFFSKYAPLD